MTPNELDVLIHYSVSPANHPRFDAPAVKEAINKFVDLGLFYAPDEVNKQYKPTEFGRAWLNLILSTPLPVQRYIDPRTG